MRQRGKAEGTQASSGRGALLWLALLAAALYAAGFAVFVTNLPKPVATDDASADAIVALTGEGDRLAPAVALLEMGNARRLLISGVNMRTSKAELRSLLHGGTAFDCCADLGFTAADTRGNAEETARWVHAHHYSSLIVVTAAYHMPRSLLEFGAEMPDVQLIAYPVPGDLPNAPSWQGMRRLSSEYTKYLASWLRISFSKLTHTL